MKTNNAILIVIMIILVAVISILGTYIYLKNFHKNSIGTIKNQINSFADCVAAGNPVREIYPEQCIHNGKIFTNEVNNKVPVFPTKPAVEEKPVGGDKDEHGCLVGAGYSWCEEKNKCIRAWEESCEPKKEEVKKEVSTEEGIISAMAKKYNKKEKEVTINISKEEGNYARGEVTLAPGGPGNSGMFLAKKINGEWEIIHDGNGLPDCDKLIKEHHPPKSMIGDLCGN